LPRKSRPRRRRPAGWRLPRWIWLVLIGLTVLGRLLGLWPDLPPSALTPGVYSVREVVDGDTLRLANGARVRLIGVDAPEPRGPDGLPEPFALEAAEFVRGMVATHGGEVRLEFDRVLQDRYGRFLAYVYAGDLFINEELVRQGLARARLEFDYSSYMKARFREAEREAQKAGRGIWSLAFAEGSSGR
jgi:micrococcal nuclease